MAVLVLLSLLASNKVLSLVFFVCFNSGWLPNLGGHNPTLAVFRHVQDGIEYKSNGGRWDRTGIGDPY